MRPQGPPDWRQLPQTGDKAGIEKTEKYQSQKRPKCCCHIPLQILHMLKKIYSYFKPKRFRVIACAIIIVTAAGVGHRTLANESSWACLKGFGMHGPCSPAEALHDWLKDLLSTTTSPRYLAHGARLIS